MQIFVDMATALKDWWNGFSSRDEESGMDYIRKEIEREMTPDFTLENADYHDFERIRKSEKANKEIGIERDGVLERESPSEMTFRIKSDRLRANQYFGLPQANVRFSKVSIPADAVKGIRVGEFALSN